MQALSDHIAKILSNLPKVPGVYQMKDEKGGVIYVGKSVNLKSRVSSYFQESSDLTLAKRQMVGKIADIEIITCENEVEALILETNLIKHFKPKYNILMKDDKNLVYIKVNRQKIVSTISYTRQKKNDGSLYFGPYTGGMQISRNLPKLKQLFGICSKIPRFGGTRDNPTFDTKNAHPCLDYYFQKCSGICTGNLAKITLHEESIDHFIDFMKGNTSDLLTNLETKMREYAYKHEFERAGEVQSQIAFVRGLQERQSVRDLVDGNHDVIVWKEKNNTLYFAVAVVRDGQMIGIFRSQTRLSGESEEYALSQFLASRYVGSGDLPQKIFVSSNQWEQAIQDFFDAQKIEILLPKIGAKKQLLDFAKSQLREYVFKTEMEKIEQKTGTKAHMKNILDTLGYVSPKKGAIIFECYDISHTHGQYTYGSRVVIKNGKSEPSLYKKYKIKTLEKGEIDDFASHREVMYRRGLEAREQDNLPDLIIIDGGKGQLSRAISGLYQGYNEAVKKEKFSVIPDTDPESHLSSVIPDTDPESHRAKRDTKKILNQAQDNKSENAEGQSEELKIIKKEDFQICAIAKREEEVFVPSQKEALIFEKHTPELMILQKARDESHRFSIGENRSARTKNMKKNILEALPGIGPTTRKKLLKLAGSIDSLRDFSEQELLAVINKRQLETLRDHGVV